MTKNLFPPVFIPKTPSSHPLITACSPTVKVNGLFDDILLSNNFPFQLSLELKKFSLVLIYLILVVNLDLFVITIQNIKLEL